jgi:hypothetical protein
VANVPCWVLGQRGAVVRCQTRGRPALDMGWPADLSWYNLLRDWGSLVGGGFALIAGILAYLSGCVQANAVRQQNTYLKRADRQRQARERLQAARMLHASMQVIADVSQG